LHNGTNEFIEIDTLAAITPVGAAPGRRCPWPSAPGPRTLPHQLASQRQIGPLTRQVEGYVG